MNEPCLPGTSPFHVRGSSYLGLREHIDQHVPGGLEAVLPHLPDADHRAFLRRLFLPVAWHDVLPIVPITEAIAVATGVPYAESVRSRARATAERDAGGVYRLLLRVASPALVAERLQRASLRYFDFARIDVVAAEPTRSTCRLVGFPRPLLKWFVPMSEGYAAALFALAHAGAPRVAFDAPVPDGERMGVETVTTGFHLSWR